MLQDAFGFLDQEVLIEECVIERDRLVSVSIHAITFMLEHEPELENDLVFRVQMLYNLFEYAILLRLSHNFEQLVESVGRENLPISLAKEKEFTKDQQDCILLIFKSEKELLLETDVLIACSESN